MSDQPKPATGEWTAGHDGMGKWGIYHGEETRKGWSGKGRLIVDGLLEPQAKAIEQSHATAIAAEREAYVSQREDWIREIQQLQDQLAKVDEGK